MKSGEFGFVPSLMFVSSQAHRSTCSSDTTVLSHIAIPNQNAGCSSKSQESRRPRPATGTVTSGAATSSASSCCCPSRRHWNRRAAKARRAPRRPSRRLRSPPRRRSPVRSDCPGRPSCPPRPYTGSSAGRRALEAEGQVAVVVRGRFRARARPTVSAPQRSRRRRPTRLQFVSSHLLWPAACQRASRVWRFLSDCSAGVKRTRVSRRAASPSRGSRAPARARSPPLLPRGRRPGSTGRTRRPPSRSPLPCRSRCTD